MPKLIVEGVGEFEVPAGKRLVKALVEEAGTDQLHACGGVARCTTCRVEILSGSVNQMTVAERDVRNARGISNPEIRLSCQLTCDDDLTVRLISRLAGSGRKDQGSAVADAIQPAPEWI
jgi:ferredoxin